MGLGRELVGQVPAESQADPHRAALDGHRRRTAGGSRRRRAAEPSLYGVWESNINQLLPMGYQGKDGLGTHSKCTLCKVYKLNGAPGDTGAAGNRAAPAEEA